MGPADAPKFLLIFVTVTALRAPAQSAPQLVAPSPDPVVRFAVVHTHADDMCFGYLDFSRTEMRYRVARPARYAAHAFQHLRADLISARMQPSFRLKGSVAEFGFRDGSKHSFGRVRPAAVDSQGEKSVTLLSLQEIVEAVDKFEVIAARLEGRDPPAETAAASKPAQTRPAETKPPAAKPQPAVVKPATLVITTHPPGAQVWVDDNSRGPTDAQSGQMAITRVPPGRSYRVRVAADGYHEWTQTVTAAAGQTLAVEARLTSAGPPPLSALDIVGLLQGEVPAARVAAIVAERGVDFALTDSIERQIRAAGGDAELLVAIAKAKK
jgi:hypothetical protein